jgi:hypothetical protein
LKLPVQRLAAASTATVRSLSVCGPEFTTGVLAHAEIAVDARAAVRK